MTASTRQSTSTLSTAALPNARLFSSIVLAALFGVACAQSTPSDQTPGNQNPDATAVQAAIVTTHSVHVAAGNADAGNVQFDAPVVDLKTWQGTPAGTGNFSLGLASGAVSGGQESAGASGLDPASTLWHEVIISDFSAHSGNALVVQIDDATFAAGTISLDKTHAFVSLVDIASGSDLADASSGTITLSAAGSAVGTRITGSINAQFQPACQLANMKSVSGSLSFTTSAGSPTTTVDSNNVLANPEWSCDGTPAILIGDWTDSPQLQLAIEFSICPSAGTTLTIGNGVDVLLFPNLQASADGVPATGGTVTLTNASGGLDGTVSVTFPNGGSATASFSLE